MAAALVAAAATGGSREGALESHRREFPGAALAFRFSWWSGSRFVLAGGVLRVMGDTRQGFGLLCGWVPFQGIWRRCLLAVFAVVKIQVCTVDTEGVGGLLRPSVPPNAPLHL